MILLVLGCLACQSPRQWVEPEARLFLDPPEELPLQGETPISFLLGWSRDLAPPLPLQAPDSEATSWSWHSPEPQALRLQVIAGPAARPVQPEERQPMRGGLALRAVEPSQSPGDQHLEIRFYSQDGGPMQVFKLHGTVLGVDARLYAAQGGGSPLVHHNKLLILGQATLQAQLTPEGPWSGRWLFDGDGRFLPKAEAAESFQAGVSATPSSELGLHRIHFLVEGKGHHLKASRPLSLTAPRRVELAGEPLVISSSGWFNQESKYFDLIRHVFHYRILDQSGQSLRQSAYGGAVPQARENIAEVLGSPLQRMLEFLQLNLRHNPDWIDVSSGNLYDRIQGSRLSMKWLLTEDGDWHPSLFQPKATVLEVVEPAFHIWELSVNGRQIVPVTQNKFRCQVWQVREKDQQTEIKVRSLYEVHLP
ncbi:MAG: hypothetical protein DWQ01_05665 [Planctomycetota bacterium]|nr:MAG: hypothetical protein DWQ01_05665 [Planctomycetota bacterium]